MAGICKLTSLRWKRSRSSSTFSLPGDVLQTLHTADLCHEVASSLGQRSTRKRYCMLTACTVPSQTSCSACCTTLLSAARKIAQRILEIAQVEILPPTMTSPCPGFHWWMGLLLGYPLCFLVWPYSHYSHSVFLLLQITTATRVPLYSPCICTVSNPQELTWVSREEGDILCRDYI